MHADAFDRYHHGHSPLHSLDPRVKVIVTIVFILSNALLPDGAWMAFLLAWSFIIFANTMSGLGVGFTFKRSFIALPFALAAITVLFSIPGRPVSLLPIPDVELDDHRRRFAAFHQHRRPFVVVGADGDPFGGGDRFPKIIHALSHLRVPDDPHGHHLVPLSIPVRADG